MDIWVVIELALRWTVIGDFKATPTQVKLLTTNNSFCFEQRATAQSKTGMHMVMAWLKLLRFQKPAYLAVEILSLALKATTGSSIEP
jgi:hypothetical protein